MRIKIVSDGNLRGTTLVNADTDEVIEDVISVQWSASVENDDVTNGYGGKLVCTVKFAGVAINAIGIIPETLEEYKAKLASYKARKPYVERLETESEKMQRIARADWEEFMAWRAAKREHEATQA